MHGAVRRVDSLKARCRFGSAPVGAAVRQSVEISGEYSIVAGAPTGCSMLCVGTLAAEADGGEEISGLVRGGVDIQFSFRFDWGCWAIRRSRARSVRGHWS